MTVKLFRLLSTVVCTAITLACTLTCAYGVEETAYTMESEQHAAYMNGRTTLQFKPNDNMTRAEAAQIVYSLLTQKPPITKSLKDVPSNKWYSQAVNSLYSAGIVHEKNTEGMFFPESTLTRVELAEILYYFCDNKYQDNKCNFSDVPEENYWTYKFVSTVNTKGWMNGKGDGAFHPSDPLTRAEATATFNRLLGRKADVDTIKSAPNMRVFTDVTQDLWSYTDIMEATVSHQYTKDAKERWTNFTAPDTGLPTGVYMSDYHLYYVDPNTHQFARNTNIAGYTLDADGRYTTGDKWLDSTIYEMVSKHCVDKAASEDNLCVMYSYLCDNLTYSARPHVKRGATGWELEYAKNALKSWKGNCYSWGAAFHYIARSIGFESYARSGAVTKQVKNHGWAEIMFDDEWYIFDPELDSWTAQKLQYYKIPYDNGFQSFYKYW